MYQQNKNIVKHTLFLIAMMSIGAITGCFKAPSYPIEPHIEFARYEFAGTNYKLGDTGFLVLRFTDGDGDLGKLNNADSSSQYVYKNLKNDTFFSKFSLAYNIPIIPNKGTSISIDGEIKLKLASLMIDNEFYFIQRGISKDTFSYSIYVTDRAQHKSNTIITPPIVVSYP